VRRPARPVGRGAGVRGAGAPPLLAVGLAFALGCAGLTGPPPTVVVVTATWDGADALSVEQGLLEPLEQALSGVPGVQRADGRADDGLALVELTLAGDDLSVVRDAIPTSALPADAGVPVVVRREPGVVWLGVSPERVELVASELEQSPDVSEVVLHGRGEPEIEVEVDPVRLATYGLDVTTLISGLRTCHMEVPAGRIGGAEDPAGLAECPIAAVRIGDLATVSAAPGEVRALGPDGAAAILEVRTRNGRIGHLDATPLAEPVRARPADLRALHAALPDATIAIDGDDALIWGDVATPPAGFEIWAPRGEVNEVVVTGPDLDQVAALVHAVREEIGRAGPATWTDLAPERPEVDFVVDRDRAAALGIPIGSVADAIALAQGGLVVGQSGDADVRLIVEGATPEDVGAIVLRAQDGSQVPLSDLVTVTLGARRAILHKDRQRGASILVDGEVPDLSGIPIPAGMAITVR
jgi:multidrug efflux pump subunit AcrB